MTFISPSAFAADPSDNVALGKPAVADSEETSNFGAAKAFDGDTTSKASRWSTAEDATPSQDGGPHWIYVDLEQDRTIQTVCLFWELRKAKGYKIQVAATDSAPAVDSDEWQTVYSTPDHPASLNETIEIENPIPGRFVRLYIDANTHADPDGGVAWGTVSLFEIELYEGAPAMSMDDVANVITVTTPEADAETLEFSAPSSEEYEVTYNGTDYEQVVDANLGIHRPLVDTTVVTSFKIVSKSDPSKYTFKEISVTIPGANQVAEGDNAAPDIMPELRQWKGGQGTFAPTGRVLYADESLARAANELAADYKDLFGSEIAVAAASEAGAGDILLTLNGNEALGDEGYDMTVTDRVVVDAAGTAGAYWSTRTILQALKTGDMTIPQGMARDYPLYKVRGFMLDVGRKTFTMDYLQQMAKQLAWFKLNDFHVHLNDNYIWVEEYTDDTVDQAYSGFRLESDIKEGGNGGLNKADLTSTDVWYTKDEFRSFIEDSAQLGLSIVPEFDMPAHSLAFTKVRPDLRTPRSMTHRGNDHLDISNKYEESFDFATQVWDEYLKGDNPTFGSAGTVHIGADEFEADGNAYRTFVNDMFSYVEETGRTPRVWGSLSQIKGSVDVSGVNENGERREINLWNTGWANMKSMYDLGFGLINTQDAVFYMVPNATYYGDYLNPTNIYGRSMNSYGSDRIPAGDPQMYGGTFAVWNDMVDKRENGMSEYDIYDRINTVAGSFAAATWGRGEKDAATAQATIGNLGDAPRTNFGYDVPMNDEGEIAHYTWDEAKDLAGNFSDAELSEGAELATADGKSVLSLTTPESFATTGIGTVGLGNDLRVKVKRTSDADEQILFESDYGQIKAVQKGTGKVGISRENHDYSFNYELPIGEWVELEFKNEQNFTTLYVNGELVEKIGVEGRGNLKATAMFPVERIGAKENGFVGFIDDVRIGVDKDYASTMALDLVVMKAEGVLAQNNDEQLALLINDAKALIDTFDPAPENIQDALAEFDAYLAEAPYEKADYTLVDALIAATPSDLSAYTDESVAKLRAAIEKAEANHDLPAAMQGTVDGFEKALLKARAALVEKDGSQLFVDGLTATASSEETAGENAPASNAVDGNPRTFWHSKWSGAAAQPPHWIDVALPKAQEVSGLTYMPRSDSKNGALKAYRVEVKTADGDYQTVAEGRVDKVNTAQTIMFEPIKNATNVRLHYLESEGGFATAGEIKVHTVLPPATADDLATLISEAEQLTADPFTADTWAPFAEALAAANDDPEDVNAATIALRTRMLALVTQKSDTDPTEPTEPTDPSEPSEPSEPTDPTGPSEPTDPSEPTEPGEPTDPTDPGEPSEPSEPTDPSDPDEPTAPTDETNPSDQTQPSDPTVSTDPSKPGDHNDPLAKTGVNVAGLAFAGIALLLGGAVIVALRRHKFM